MPSTVAWCILENTAIRPSASPSMTHISHSGRDRSSGMPGEVAGHLGELVGAAGRGQGEPVDVPVDVEVRRRRPTPGGRGRAARGAASGGTRARRRPGGPSPPSSRRRSSRPGSSPGWSTRRPQTCSSCVERLEVEEGRVESAEPLHGGILRPRTGTRSSSEIRLRLPGCMACLPAPSAGHRRPGRQRRPARARATSPASRRCSPAGSSPSSPRTSSPAPRSTRALELAARTATAGWRSSWARPTSPRLAYVLRRGALSHQTFESGARRRPRRRLPRRPRAAARRPRLEDAAAPAGVAVPRRPATASRSIKNISYAPEHGRRGLLDVYRPEGDVTRRARSCCRSTAARWTIGNKDQQGLPLMKHMASRGWVCVAINYRLSPRVRLPRAPRRRQARDRLDPRARQGVRRRPVLHRDHRRLGRRPPGRAGGPDPQRPRVPARLRGRRHRAAGRGAVLRRLRPGRRHRQQGRACGCATASWPSGCSSTDPARGPRAVREGVPAAAGAARTPRPSTSSTASTTPWSTIGQARAFVEALREASDHAGRLQRAVRHPARLRRVPLGPQPALGARRRPVPPLGLGQLEGRAHRQRGGGLGELGPGRRSPRRPGLSDRSGPPGLTTPPGRLTNFRAGYACP